MESDGKTPIWFMKALYQPIFTMYFDFPANLSWIFQKPSVHGFEFEPGVSPVPIDPSELVNALQRI